MSERRIGRPKASHKPAEARKAAKVSIAPASAAKSAQPAQKRPMGRPSIYTPELAQQVFDYMAQGYSLDGAAGLIGISHDSMYRWQREHPEFSEAVKNGRVAGTAFWEKQLMAITQGAPGNITGALFGLKNRSRAASGWHDIQKTEVSGVDGKAIQTEMRATIDAKALAPDAREVLRAAVKTAKNVGS